MSANVCAGRAGRYVMWGYVPISKACLETRVPEPSRRTFECETRVGGRGVAVATPSPRRSVVARRFAAQAGWGFHTCSSGNTSDLPLLRVYCSDFLADDLPLLVERVAVHLA